MSNTHSPGRHVRGRLCAALVISVGFALLGIAQPARALIITPTFDSSITNDPNAAAIEGVINSAISVYEHTFSNPITVTIKFQEQSTGLGNSFTSYAVGPYSTYIAALQANATSAADFTALAHLPTGPDNPVNGTTEMDVKTANLRAVGINVFPSGFDGTILLNTHITDVGSPGTSGVYSLLATTEHEIDEVLGLGSALPSLPFGNPFPEDLFRYDGSGNRSFTTSSSAKSYFSIDGTTLLAQFNQDSRGDYGDWQSTPRPSGVAPQVQDAFATANAHPTLGKNEITALDVIGYTLTSVPEPSSGTLLLSGTLALAGLGWHRRHAAKKAA